MTILQVSVAQINAQLGDVNANLNTHQDYEDPPGHARGTAIHPQVNP